MFKEWFYIYMNNETCLKRPLKKDKTMVLKPFCGTFDLH